MDYVKKVASLPKMTDLFEGYASKPDIIIDDMPQPTVAPEESSWPTMAYKIISKHVD